MRFFLAKAVPYILTFFAGAGVFFLSFYKPTVWSDWLVEISGALSAIPIVFLIYDYSNYKLTARVNKTLTNNLTFEINAVVLKLLRMFRGNLAIRAPLSWQQVEKMLMMPRREIKKSLKFGKQDLTALQEYKQELDDLIYKAADANVFEQNQFDAAAAMPRVLSGMINELEFRGGRDQLAAAVDAMFTQINNWFDSCEEEALKNHSHFRLMQDLAKK